MQNINIPHQFFINTLMQFMTITGTNDINEGVAYLHQTNWCLQDAISVKALCSLRSISNSFQQPSQQQGGIDTSNLFNKNPYGKELSREQMRMTEKNDCENQYEKTNPALTKNKFDINRSGHRKKRANSDDIDFGDQNVEIQVDATAKSTEEEQHEEEITEIKKARKSRMPAKSLNEVLNGRNLTNETLEEFLAQKPAPRWKYRLEAFQKFNSQLVLGDLSYLFEHAKSQNQFDLDDNEDDQFPLDQSNSNLSQKSQQNSNHKRNLLQYEIDKAILDFFPKTSDEQKAKRNLQRGLIKYLVSDGFTYLSGARNGYFVFSKRVK
ncbi:hypothetical protein M0811_02286 [Anaeramoeba ignava]|uniref:Uncharacterized protein n=1 Tax=Anaeramoeba ignava TaxID=1746090 RepID=A0A9Q0LC98_ANAIG|nr:hypothetical protein M0811_02286 [Anaeramoeba ignava]|eukprot:Anaeramoba_ignava/c18702_g1_i2.p1 GENE.c18702_g1_i2~~c18702_g1_i2.p1  ORF type:complete len:323 (+),score=90.26 c18702_g1_i2:143-1111(+)